MSRFPAHDVNYGGRNRRGQHPEPPRLLVVEDLYADYTFPRTAILMGHAGRGLPGGAPTAGSGAPLAPAEMKRAVAANGRASKVQVQRGVQRLLGLSAVPRPAA
ncbi:MAG: crossover junction endodeoxyribonuclease RuvC [Candidatus Methylomirabilia bacterium]